MAQARNSVLIARLPCFRLPNTESPATSGIQKAKSGIWPEILFPARTEIAGWAPETVSVSVVCVPFGVTGLALHVAEDDGENEHEKLIWLV